MAGAASGGEEPESQPTVRETAPVAVSQAPAVDDPKELLASANTASGSARNAWLAFLGLLAYLMVTLAGVTHVDLLLNSPVTLPIVNVKIPLSSFFLAAPFLFLLVHLGLLVQHAMLAHKYQHFCTAIAAGEEGQGGNHPDRQLVHTYVFAQILAGPKPPWPLHMLMRLMVFVTFSLLPVLVLLYFQVKFLPSHDVAITHAHRIAILFDLTVLFVVRPFVAMPYLRTRGKKLAVGNESWRWEMSYASLAIAGLMSLVVVSFSLLVATVPQACFWPFVWPFGQPEDETCFSLDRTTAQWWPVEVQSGGQTRAALAPTKWLFEGKLDEISGTPQSLFSRNLIVTDKDLVAKKDFEEGEMSLPLRGRDLRFAVLNRSDLRRADLVGSDFRGVSALETRLNHANFGNAQMQGANLKWAQMQGANLKWAQMQGADLEKARMQGANLKWAQMKGANLAWAQMQGADLQWAQMQGANLRWAQMQGANLRLAEMQGADLGEAQMQGAHLGGAQMQGANLRGVRLWQTRPPEVDSLQFAVPMKRTSIAPLSPLETAELEALITEAKDEALRAHLKERLGPLLDTSASHRWGKSPESDAWTAFSSRDGPDPIRLGNYLAELACSDNSGGYIIGGIVGRVWKAEEAVAELLAERLIDKEICPAARHLSEEALASLEKFAASNETEATPTPAQ